MHVNSATLLPPEMLPSSLINMCSLLYPDLHETDVQQGTYFARYKKSCSKLGKLFGLRARSPSYSLWEDNTQQWYFITSYITHHLCRNFLFFGTGRFKIGHNMNEIARKICHSSPEQKEIVTKCRIYKIF